jgi:hypothetical protein
MRRGRQIYIDNDVWKLVEEKAEKDKRSVNRWLEMLLTAHFLKEKIKEK